MLLTLGHAHFWWVNSFYGAASIVTQHKVSISVKKYVLYFDVTMDDGFGPVVKSCHSLTHISEDLECFLLFEASSVQTLVQNVYHLPCSRYLDISYALEESRASVYLGIDAEE